MLITQHKKIIDAESYIFWELFEFKLNMFLKKLIYITLTEHFFFPSIYFKIYSIYFKLITK